MIEEIIVVEGKSDSQAIRRAVEAETIETGGSAINRGILDQISLAQKRRGIIIFTDPDHAGERIRKIISSNVPGCKHAFLSREEADYKGNIGIENADPDAIRRALEHVRTECRDVPGQISWRDLLENGLITEAGAAKRRLAMGNMLGIGYANGKQFYHRCRMFQITREEFLQALRRLDEEANPREGE